MNDSCRCRGEGMYWNEERKRMVVCACPVGESKKRYFDMTPAERRESRKKRRRKKKPEPEQDRIPF